MDLTCWHPPHRHPLRGHGPGDCICDFWRHPPPVGGWRPGDPVKPGRGHAPGPCDSLHHAAEVAEAVEHLEVRRQGAAGTGAPATTSTGAESFRDTSGQLLAPRAAGEAEDAGWPSHRQAPALNLLPDPGILLPHQGLQVLQRHRAAPHPVTQGTAPGRHLAIEPTDTLPDQAQLLLRWPTAHTLGQDFQGVGMPPSQAALGFSRGSSRGSDTSRATASEAHGSPPRT
jgi:hypothetical protein